MVDFVMGRRDGSQYTLKYNPETNELFTEEGTPVTLNLSEEMQPQTLPGLKIRISLGKACNFNCRYCCQHMGSPDPISNISIERLVDQILNVAGDQEIAQVQCWGGEPLVYFETVKKIHSLCKERIPNLPTFFISTNGSLLHGEVLDWILENNITVALSWDGPGQFLRGVDVLKDDRVLQAVRKIYAAAPDRIVFAPVMTKSSPRHKVVADMLKDYLGTDKFLLSESRAITVVDDASMEIAIPMEELPAFSRQLYMDMLSGEIPQLYMSHNRAFTLAASVGRGIGKSIRCKCFVGDPDTLVVDMSGNLLTCHTFSASDVDVSGEKHCIGQIFDMKPGERKKIPEMRRLKERQAAKCKNCAVYAVCVGGCTYEPVDYEDYNCAANYYQFLPIVGKALHILTGDILLEAR